MTRVRLGTANLLHGFDVTDGTTREETLRRGFRGLDVDVLGLQEVDRHQPRSDGLDQTAAVADEVGATWWRFAPALVGTPGGSWVPATEQHLDGFPGPSYGVGLLTRFPVRSWTSRTFRAARVGLPLAVPGRGLVRVPDEPRVALAAVLDGPAGPVTVVTVHLSFVPGWNVAQLRALVRWLAPLPRPRLLLGDLNLPGRLPARVTGWTPLARVATYPAWRPRVQWDHVLADGLAPGAAHSATAHRLPVSDHRALLVDVEL